MGKIDKFSMKLQARHSFSLPSLSWEGTKKVKIEENCFFERGRLYYKSRANFLSFGMENGEIGYETASARK